jgi:hypothetical protein
VDINFQSVRKTNKNLFFPGKELFFIKSFSGTEKKRKKKKTRARFDNNPPDFPYECHAGAINKGNIFFMSFFFASSSTSASIFMEDYPPCHY